MTVTGPDFLSIQVRDLQRSAAFYERELNLTRLSDTPPGVIAFNTTPIPFAVRDPLPGIDLDAGPVGLGVLVSLHADDAEAVHDQLRDHGVPILMDRSTRPSAGRSCSPTRMDTRSPSTAPRISANGRGRPLESAEAVSPTLTPTCS